VIAITRIFMTKPSVVEASPVRRDMTLPLRLARNSPRLGKLSITWRTHSNWPT
jgi:hypothetical protein